VAVGIYLYRRRKVQVINESSPVEQVSGGMEMMEKSDYKFDQQGMKLESRSSGKSGRGASKKNIGMINLKGMPLSQDSPQKNMQPLHEASMASASKNEAPDSMIKQSLPHHTDNDFIWVDPVDEEPSNVKSPQSPISPQ